jgi:hypothetical protein
VTTYTGIICQLNDIWAVAEWCSHLQIEKLFLKWSDKADNPKITAGITSLGYERATPPPPNVLSIVFFKSSLVMPILAFA